MQRGKCIAPPLTEDRLNCALEHSNTSIRSLAKFVEDFKKTQLIEKADLPSMDLILTTESQINQLDLQGEEKASAFHVIWYLKELSLGRNPEL